MFQSGPFTRAKVGRLTGLSDDVLGHWTKEALLKPVSSVEGTGRHKEFDRIEVVKAAVLGHLRAIGVNITVLRWFSNLVDRAREIVNEYPLIPPELYGSLSQGLGQANQFRLGEAVIVYDPDDIPNRVKARNLEEIANDRLVGDDFSAVVKEEFIRGIRSLSCDKTDLIALEVLGDLTAYENPYQIQDSSVWFIWQEGKSWNLYSDGDGNLANLDLQQERNKFFSGIVIRVAEIRRDIWHPGRRRG